jgi:hypothetical protein
MLTVITCNVTHHQRPYSIRWWYLIYCWVVGGPAGRSDHTCCFTAAAVLLLWFRLVLPSRC